MARAVMPANMAIVMPAMIVMVLAALRLFGGLKFGTPLLTASTPVRAVQPWAKARNASSSTAAPAALCSGATEKDADSARGAWPVAACHRPQQIITKTT